MTDIELITQPAQVVYGRVILKDRELNTLSQFEGDILRMNMTVDNTSTIRRTLSLTVSSVDGANVLSALESVWIDKVVTVQYGVHDPDRNKTKWFDLGTFVLSNSTYSFGVGKQEIEMTLVDLMALTMNIRGSQIGHEVTITMDSEIHNVIKDTIEKFTTITHTDIVNFDGDVPYDLELGKGIYPFELLKKLVELYPYYDQYVSRDGVYTVSVIPMTQRDANVLSAEDMEQLIISEEGGGDYSEIANVAEIWGEELDAQYTAKQCVTKKNVYELYISDNFEVLEEGMTVSFTADTDSVMGQEIKIQNTTARRLYTQKGDGSYSPTGTGALLANTAYAIRYTNGIFVLQGELIVHGIAMEFNSEPDEATKEHYRTEYDCRNISFVVNEGSKFTVDTPGIGVVKRVFEGKEYEDIYTTELALERARYELWLACRQRNSKTLRCVYVPWLDVNQKIEYTSIVDGTTRQYLVEKIITSYDGTMTLTVSQFYPLYQWLDVTTWGQLSHTTWGDVKDIKWGDIDEYDK